MARPPIEAPSELTPADKLRLSLEMADYGIEMMRQNLRRAHPHEGDAAIEERLIAWLRHRPGAEHGDCPGRPLTWPLRRHDDTG